MERPSCVLIIDDDPVTRETLAALLARTSYRLEFASSGLEGLALAPALRPDVILLDVMMPGMDGYEVCRRLRQDSLVAAVPVIMITALYDRAARLAGLAAGADDFLTKPFDRLELETRLNSLRQVNRYRQLIDERDKLAAVRAELSEKNARLNRLSELVLETQEAERRRLAIDLHDEIGQSLTSLKTLLQGDDLARTRLDQALSVVDSLLERVREMALNLKPALLDDRGLFAALDWFFTRFSRDTGLRVQHNVDALSERRFARNIETALFRVVQEALTNVARHAQVAEVNVTLTIESDEIQLTVQDRGVGFDPAVSRPAATGLSGMEERVRLAGGRFRLQSALGGGALITAEFPL